MQLLEHPKVVKMQQLMVEKGLPGAPNNIGPVAKPTAAPAAQNNNAPTDQLEAKVEELK